MPSEHRSYLDCAATTPVDPRVLDAMLPFLGDRFGNPNSLYAHGRDARAALEEARERFAAAIGATHPNEVLFTSGGTESDTSALIGITRKAAPGGGHVIVSAFEHHAVLEPAHALEKSGYEVTYLRPRADGYVHADDVAAALRPDTTLVSVMHANNEIGTVQPIRAIADAAHEVGALVHTDACQSLGKVPFDVDELGVDAASFSAHKIYGPKGVGALYLRRHTPFEPLLKGGGQEFKRRSGTQNVPGIVGFAVALDLMLDTRAEEEVRLRGLADRIVSELVARLPNVEPTVPRDGGPMLPNIVSLLVKGVEGESMLLQLDDRGIEVSTGSACSSGSLEPSHVLLACGIPPEVAHGSLRVSLGRFTTADDVERLIDELPPIVERLRAMNPLYERMYGAAARG